MGHGLRRESNELRKMVLDIKKICWRGNLVGLKYVGEETWLDLYDEHGGEEE